MGKNVKVTTIFGASLDIVLPSGIMLGKKNVILHDELLQLSQQAKIPLPKTELLYASDRMVIFRASYVVDLEGKTTHYEEIGEASPANLETAIANAYPATMAHKRAVDRMLITALGLKPYAYSDSEVADIKPVSKKPSEELFALGKYKDDPISLDDLVQKDEDYALSFLHKEVTSPKLIALQEIIKEKFEQKFAG